MDGYKKFVNQIDPTACDHVRIKLNYSLKSFSDAQSPVLSIAKKTVRIYSNFKNARSKNAEFAKSPKKIPPALQKFSH